MRRERRLRSADDLVRIFNEMFPVGSVVLWRSVGKDLAGNEHHSYVVASPAFNSYGNAVVFFQGKSGFCSIEPQFVKYD